MKLNLLSIAVFATLAIPGFSQNSRLNPRTNNNPTAYRMGVPVETKSPSALRNSPVNVQFSNDVIVNPQATTDQRNVKIATAFNGWIYAAYTTMNAGTGGIAIDKSTDGGVTWTSFVSGGSAGLVYVDVDLTVAGSDTTNLVVYIAGVLNNSGTYVAWLDKYNGVNGAFMGENFSESPSSSESVYDISIATDFANPSIASTPYSVAVTYSKSNASADSLIYAVSLDGGATYVNRTVVLATGYYLRKISIAYGHSSIWSNGRYFIVFENRNGATDDIGNIGFVYTQSDPSSSFSVPMYLDSVDAGMAAKMRYPKISLENDNLSNDSGGVSAVVTADRQYSTTDRDVLSMVSQVTVYSALFNWHRLDIDNSSSYGLQGDVMYSANAREFGVTYYDSSTAHLNIVKTGVNVTPASSFSNVVTQYNDLTTNLKAAQPRLSRNPVDTSFEVVWNAEGASNNGVAMYDQENFGTGIPAISHAYNFDNPYPNPSSGSVNFNFTLTEMKHVQLSIVNLLGENVIETNDLGTLPAGEQTVKADLSGLANGIYVYRMMIGTELVTGQLVVAHQ